MARGARGIGKQVMVPTMPAIANAVYNAVSVRLESPPQSTEKIFLALQEEG